MIKLYTIMATNIIKLLDKIVEYKIKYFLYEIPGSENRDCQS